jgi:signal transduction histidine kinase
MLKKLQFYKTYIILGVAFLLVLITGVGVYQANQNKEVLTESLVETFQILDLTDELLAGLIDAEAGQRGYLLTNSDEYLEPYNRSRDQIDDLYAKLENVFEGDEEVLLLVQQELKPRIDLRMNLLQEIIYLYRSGNREEALSLLISNVGKETMDEIRGIIGELKSGQEELLQDKTRDMQTILGQADFVIFSGFTFILLAIAIAAISIRRRVTENVRLIKRIDDSNILLVKSKERETVKNRFMGIVAHDLRNPLSMIKSINSMMIEEKDQLSDEHAEYVEFIEQASDQMNYLITELLDVQKIEEGRVDIYIEELRIYKIINGLILGHTAHAEEKSIQLIFDDESADQYFKTDKSIFLQVADNLISNALKYSPQNTLVHIKLESDNGKLVFSVSDQGPGIKEEEKKYLFERYGSLSNQPTGDEKSTGLGLWIVKERITALGGSIRCESEEGKGAFFIAEFPNEHEIKVSGKKTDFSV